MQQIKKKLELSKPDYYEAHLSLINYIILPSSMKMTPMETKILASFMALEGDVATYRFGSTARKLVRNQHGISPAGLSNYITSLTNKKLLKVNGDITSILPLLLPEENEQLYMFKLVNLGNIVTSNGTSVSTSVPNNSKVDQGDYILIDTQDQNQD